MAENELERRKRIERQIKEQVNIIDVIGQYYTLTDVSKGKKPKVLSIEEAKTKRTVSTQEHDSIRIQTSGRYANTYIRWSTNASGNAFDFLINEIGMTFNEAFKVLEPMIDPSIDPSQAATVNQQALKEKQKEELRNSFDKHLKDIVKTKIQDENGEYSLEKDEVLHGFRWIQQFGLKYPDFKWDLFQQWKDCYEGVGFWEIQKGQVSFDKVMNLVLSNPGDIIFGFVGEDEACKTHANRIVSHLKNEIQDKDRLYREVMDFGWRAKLHMDLAREIYKDREYRNVFAYLIQERKLSHAIVKHLQKTGVLAQEKQPDNTIFAVFIDRNKYGLIERINKKPANIKAKTYRNYPFEKGEDGINKGMLLDFHNNGYRGMSPNAHEKQLFVFEAYIDMVSFMDIQNRNGVDITQNAYLSLGGAGKGNGLFERLKENQYKEVSLCLDNDGKGAQGAIILNERLRMAGIKSDFYVSKTKDWNEDLQKGFTPLPEPTEKDFQINRWKEKFPDDVAQAYKSIEINKNIWKKDVEKIRELVFKRNEININTIKKEIKGRVNSRDEKENVSRDTKGENR